MIKKECLDFADATELVIRNFIFKNNSYESGGRQVTLMTFWSERTMYFMKTSPKRGVRLQKWFNRLRESRLVEIMKALQFCAYTGSYANDLVQLNNSAVTWYFWYHYIVYLLTVLTCDVLQNRTI